MPEEVIPFWDVQYALVGMQDIKTQALGAVSFGYVMVSSSGEAPGWNMHC